MGYRTNYVLTHKASADKEMDVVNTLNEISGYDWDSTLELYEVKWYDHENDMRAVSKRFPDVVFTLAGDGEEQGDSWRKYFRDGLMQVAHAVITYEPYHGLKCH